MLGIKGWLSGLSLLGKVGLGVATIGTAAAVGVPVSNICTSQPYIVNETSTIQVPFESTYIKDGSRDKDTYWTKKDGENGQKKQYLKVTYKCKKELSRQVTKEQTLKQPVAAEVLQGTRYSGTETESIPYVKKQEPDSTMLKGETKLKQVGVDGTKTLTYEYSQNEGQPEAKKLIKEEVTTQPIDEITLYGTKVQSNCDPNYSGGCVPNVYPSDVDCAGGSGNGPYYTYGPVYVIGYDRYGLDRDGDGVACE